MGTNNDIKQVAEILEQLAGLWAEYAEICQLKAEQSMAEIIKDQI